MKKKIYLFATAEENDGVHPTAASTSYICISEDGTNWNIQESQISLEDIDLSEIVNCYSDCYNNKQNSKHYFCNGNKLYVTDDDFVTASIVQDLVGDAHFFRWLSEYDTYVIVAIKVGSGYNASDTIYLYTSKDLENWTCKELPLEYHYSNIAYKAETGEILIYAAGGQYPADKRSGVFKIQNLDTITTVTNSTQNVYTYIITQKFSDYIPKYNGYLFFGAFSHDCYKLNDIDGSIQKLFKIDSSINDLDIKHVLNSELNGIHIIISILGQVSFIDNNSLTNTLTKDKVVFHPCNEFHYNTVPECPSCGLVIGKKLYYVDTINGSNPMIGVLDLSPIFN